MPYWHDHNPWKDDVIYITEDTLNAILKRPIMEEDYPHIDKFDCYLLPQSNNDASIGIRYGERPEQYLSPGRVSFHR